MATAGFYEIGYPGDTVDMMLTFGELDNDTLIALKSIGGEDAIDIFHFSVSESQTNDYAIITDFSSQEGDVFQVYGNIENYSLNITTSWTGAEVAETLIKLGEDTIAIVTDNTNVSLERDFFTANNALDNVEQTFIDEVILG